MPQEFEQAQSASAGQEVGDIVESAGVQVDGTADALDAVLDDAALRFAQALRRPEAAPGLKAFAARQPAPWSQSPESITP